MLERIFTAHPSSVGESYAEHFCQALSFSAALFIAAMACFVHALIPAMFPRTGSRIIERLHERMVANRARQRSSQAPAE